MRWAKFALLIILSLFLARCASSDFNRSYSTRGGVFHTVKKGQTIYGIAKAYNIKVYTLTRVNRVHDLSSVKEGRKLWIPGAKRLMYVSPTFGTTVAKGTKKQTTKKKPRWKTSKTASKKPAVKGYLMWPVKGQLTSRFGKRRGRHHDGIDVGAKKGTKVVAAGPGKVMFSGWGPTGYGLMVIIKHPNHLMTVYAHNSRNLVKENSVVKKGQRIALVGSTGRSSGPHLHFEVRNDTHPRNPLHYLP